MPVEIIKQLSVAFHGLKLWNYYGQTEMGPVATILKPDDQLLKPGSAGKPVLNVETRLMDDEGISYRWERLERSSIGQAML